MSRFNAELACIDGIIEGTVDESSLVPKFYDDLLAKPMINGVLLTGDKKGKDLGLVDIIEEATNIEIENIFK